MSEHRKQEHRDRNKLLDDAHKQSGNRVKTLFKTGYQEVNEIPCFFTKLVIEALWQHVHRDPVVSKIVQQIAFHSSVMIEV
jgi:hypothetical protein